MNDGGSGGRDAAGAAVTAAGTVAEPRPAAEDQRSVVTAAGLVFVGSVGIHTSNALATTLFGQFGSPSVSALRMLVAAGVLLVLVRPRVRGRTRSEWIGIVGYGAAMAVMNMSLYVAIARIPLGVAVTIEFLGPCAVALAASRRLREALCAVLALVGVALISAGPHGYFDLVGYAAAAFAAAAFGAYTLFSARVGKAGNGFDGLALSVTVAALLTTPLSLPAVAQLDAHSGLILLVSALLGVVITFGADTLAARVSSARVVGTLFAIDPAMGAVVGKLMLGQSIAASAAVGIVLVVVAGALLVWSAESPE